MRIKEDDVEGGNNTVRQLGLGGGARSCRCPLVQGKGKRAGKQASRREVAAMLTATLTTISTYASGRNWGLKILIRSVIRSV